MICLSLLSKLQHLTRMSTIPHPCLQVYVDRIHIEALVSIWLEEDECKYKYIRYLAIFITG